MALLTAAARVLERASQPEAVITADRLSVTTSFVRAAERGDVAKARGEAGRYAFIRTTSGTDLQKDNLRGASGIITLKNHAVLLAQQLHQETADELSSRRDELGETGYMNATKNLWRRLRRLKPESIVALNAVASEDRSDVTTEPSEMASKLAAHWATVFSAKPIDADLLRIWLDDEFPNSDVDKWKLPEADADCWKLLQSHVDKAIRLSNDSGPGPDTIPYRA